MVGCKEFEVKGHNAFGNDQASLGSNAPRLDGLDDSIRDVKTIAVVLDVEMDDELSGGDELGIRWRWRIIEACDFNVRRWCVHHVQHLRDWKQLLSRIFMK
jgi:hypothetical protein